MTTTLVQAAGTNNQPVFGILWELEALVAPSSPYFYFLVGGLFSNLIYLESIMVE